MLLSVLITMLGTLWVSCIRIRHLFVWISQLPAILTTLAWVLLIDKRIASLIGHLRVIVSLLFAWFSSFATYNSVLLHISSIRLVVMTSNWLFLEILLRALVNFTLARARSILGCITLSVGRRGSGALSLEDSNLIFELKNLLFVMIISLLDFVGRTLQLLH